MRSPRTDAAMSKALLRGYLCRKAREQQEIIDRVPVRGKRYDAAVDELEEVEDLLEQVGAL